VSTLKFTGIERRALPEASSDFAIRLKRFRRFDDAAFAIMKRAILVGDLTPAVIARVERDIVTALRNMPETLGEMTLYTCEISISVYGINHRSGWPWARYTSHKYMHMEQSFSPYGGGVSAWTDAKAPDGVVRFQ
jgi:hypothetical protein